MKNKEKEYYSYDEALERLRKYCAYQDRCHSEVRIKLIELGIYGDDLEQIVVELIEEKFLDEFRFAISYARGKFRYKKWGKQKIKKGLKMKKISEYCIKKAMQEVDSLFYEDTLRQLLEKKNDRLKETNMWKRRKKLADFAMMKGYESHLVWKIVKELTGLS